MMKILFTLFVLLFSSSVFAEWTKVGTTVAGDGLYVDIRTIKIVGGTRYFLDMTDYVVPSPYGDLSSSSYTEINCSNMMYKDLLKNYYSLPLAEGDTTEGSGQIKNPKWESFETGSAGSLLIKFVCDF